MAIQSRSNLKGKFEDGDTFTGTNAADWIDSFLHLSDTTAQSVQSPMTFAASVGFTTGVSALTVKASSISAQTLESIGQTNVGGDLVVSGNVTAKQTLGCSALRVTTTVSADEVYASAVVANGVTLGPTATSFGSVSLASSQPTTISAAGGYSEAFGGTTLDASSNRDFSMPRDFTLRYTGTIEKEFKVVAHTSMSAAGNSKNIGMRLGKAAGGDSKTEIYRFVGTGTNTGAASVGGLFKLAENQEVSLFVTNTTDTVSVTIHKINMNAIEV